jgi:hypothetical protein
MLKRERPDGHDSHLMSKRPAMSTGDGDPFSISLLKPKDESFRQFGSDDVQAEIKKAYTLYGLMLSALEAGKTDEGTSAAFKQLISYGRGASSLLTFPALLSC